MASRELPLPRGTAVARTSIEEDVLLPFFSRAFPESRSFTQFPELRELLFA